MESDTLDNMREYIDHQPNQHNEPCATSPVHSISNSSHQAERTVINTYINQSFREITKSNGSLNKSVSGRSHRSLSLLSHSRRKMSKVSSMELLAKIMARKEELAKKSEEDGLNINSPKPSAAIKIFEYPDHGRDEYDDSDNLRLMTASLGSKSRKKS